MKKTMAEFKKANAGDGRRILLKVLTVAISAAALFFTYMYMENMGRQTQETVRVVRIKRPLPAYAVVAAEEVEAYDLTRKEYDKNSMILFEDAENLVYGKYAAYFIRESTVLHLDQLTDYRPVNYLPLAELGEDEEIVTVPYNFMEAGGYLLLPGDRIRIRASHFVDDMPDYYSYNPNAEFSQSAGRTVRTDILFDSIVVVDMLNASGQPISEIYAEVMRLDDKSRQEAMGSKDFQTSTKPRSLLLAGSKSDMNRYASYDASVGSRNLLITLLSRGGGAGNFNGLPMIEMEVSTWIR
jgi:hypothetical protein